MRREGTPLAVRLQRTAAAFGGVLLLALFGAVAFESVGWVGKTFPGFFVLENRVVPSVSLRSWGDVSLLFQSQVVAVDGRAVGSAAALYDAVAQSPPRTSHTYLLRTARDESITAHIESRSFSRTDYVLTLAAPLLNGFFFAAIGLFVLWLRPGAASTNALVAACCTTGLFALTSAGLGSSVWLLRLHVAAEALMAPAYVHLAFVFPTDRMRGRRWYLAAIYLPFALFALWFAHAIGDASAFTDAHLLAAGFQGVAVLFLFAGSARHLVGRSSALARRRVGVVALGTVTGLVLPGMLNACSAALGGRVPINAGMFTAFFFPLSLAYAAVIRDVFRIDQMLLRAIGWGALATTAAGLYFGVFFAFGFFFPGRALSDSPLFDAVLDLGLLLAMVPTHTWIRGGLDRLYYRRLYDAESTLRRLGKLLASARAVDEVVRATQLSLRDTLGGKATILLRDRDGDFIPAGGLASRRLELRFGLMRRLASGEIVARYEWEDGSGRALPAPGSDRDVEILVPLHRAERLVGLLSIGPKKSGHAYNAHDVSFLQSMATQLVMALSAALAVQQLADLNAGLEEQVKARTLAFEQTNRELQDSLRRLHDAYQVLERNQAGLLRADRLATLGRLTAGLAHEINTPLAAVMNSLKVVIELGAEYSDSVGDAAVTPDDHREIAFELLANARAADVWARRAAAFLSRTKTHGRELRDGAYERFPVAMVIDEVRELLAHRLELSGCALEYVEEPEGVEVEGEPGRLSQVLVNLVANAIDAYEDSRSGKGMIRVAAERRGDKVEVRVRDWAGGIPKDVLPRIFEDLFTTKAPGRGTGLGLWIVRNLVENAFDGKMLVDSAPGRGSCFTAVLPARRSEKPAAPAAAA